MLNLHIQSPEFKIQVAEYAEFAESNKAISHYQMLEEP